MNSVNIIEWYRKTLNIQQYVSAENYIVEAKNLLGDRIICENGEDTILDIKLTIDF